MECQTPGILKISMQIGLHATFSIRIFRCGDGAPPSLLQEVPQKGKELKPGGFEGISDGGIEDKDGPVVLFRVEHSEEQEVAGREGGGAVPLPEEDFFAVEFRQDFQNLDLRKAVVCREEPGGFGEDLVTAAAEAVGGRVDVVDVVDI